MEKGIKPLNTIIINQKALVTILNASCILQLKNINPAIMYFILNLGLKNPFNKILNFHAILNIFIKKRLSYFNHCISLNYSLDNATC